MDVYEIVRNPGRNLGNVFTSLMYEASVNSHDDISFLEYFLELKYDPNYFFDYIPDIRQESTGFGYSASSTRVIMTLLKSKMDPYGNNIQPGQSPLCGFLDGAVENINRTCLATFADSLRLQEEEDEEKRPSKESTY